MVVPIFSSQAVSSKEGKQVECIVIEVFGSVISSRYVIEPQILGPIFGTWVEVCPEPNYFNTLPLREQLAQLGKCEFMDPAEFSDGVSFLKGKKRMRKKIS